MGSTNTDATRVMRLKDAEPYLCRRFRAVYCPELMAANLAAFLGTRRVKVAAEKTPFPNVSFLRLPRGADLDAVEVLLREWKADGGGNAR